MSCCSTSASGKKRRFLLPALLLFLCGFVPAPEGMWRLPIVTSEVQLAGTFGELRPDHFHAGIDIKTGGKEGVPIYAVRDGYVYRVKVDPVGYGKAVYLRHEDGKFTMYAHLSRFSDEIDEIVYQKQYASKKYDQEIYLSSNRLPVRAGQIIGYSGNTGNSFAPHLHFEVRNENDRILNPILFYRPLIEDNVPPTIFSLAVEPLRHNSRVQGEFVKREFSVSQSGSAGYVEGVIKVSGPVGIEFTGIDKLSAAENKCGINHVRLLLDGRLVYEFLLDAFSFDEKKFINLYLDYAAWIRNRSNYQRCYIEDGNLLSNYPQHQRKGIIELSDDRLHSLRLETADSYGNTTVVEAQIQREAPQPAGDLPVGEAERISLRHWISRNVLAIALYNPQPSHLDGLEMRMQNKTTQTIRPAYSANSEYVYLVPLDYNNLPEEVYEPVKGERLRFGLRKSIFPEKNNLVSFDEVQVYFPFGAAFDTLALPITKSPGNMNTWSQVYHIGDPEVPVFKPFLVQFKPPVGSDPRKLVVARQTRSGWKFEGKTLREDGTIVASPEEFGTFCLMSDSTPPSIEPVNFDNGDVIGSGREDLVLRVKDEFSGIASEKLMARIGGEWALSEYDAKSSRMIVKLRRRPPPGRHTVEIMVWDGCGNLSVRNFNLGF